MSDAAETLRQLQRQLIEAPEGKFVEVVRILEQAADNPEVRQTIQSIRPRLAQLRPARRMTLKRVFCDPFEDVLEARGAGDAPIGSIPRRFIDPVWREVAQRADPRHFEPLEQAVAGLDSHDHDGRHTLGCRLWYVAAQALKQILAAPPPSLGAENLAAASDILEFVEIGHQIVALKNALPAPPIAALDGEALKLIEAAIQETARISPAKPFFLLLTLASRMRRPADLLVALHDMDFGKARRDRDAIFAQLAALMVDGLENSSLRLEQGGAEGAPADPVSAAAMAERLVESLDSAARLLSGTGDAQYDARLRRVRDAVRSMVRRDVLENARSQVMAALPAPSAGAALPPPDDVAQETVEERARALRRCERFAGSLALAPDVAATLGAVGKQVEKDVAVWTRRLTERPLSPAEADAAELSICYAVRVLELVAGSGRADALRQSAFSSLYGAG